MAILIPTEPTTVVECYYSTGRETLYFTPEYWHEVELRQIRKMGDTPFPRNIMARAEGDDHNGGYFADFGYGEEALHLWHTKEIAPGDVEYVIA